MRRFASGPAIARLTDTPRMTVNDRLRAGKYGPTFRRGRLVYADLAEVERVAGRTFTEDNIAFAVDGQPDRLLEITKTEEITDGISQQE
jgi:hypothetical protein